MGANRLQQDASCNWEDEGLKIDRIPFPWDIFPEALTASLQQLARSCATSVTPLPGIVFGVIGAILGRSLCVSPKRGWLEPVSPVWHGDIRVSGAGKTPAQQLLLRALSQVESEERRLSLTDMTLPGLREELTEHPTGGMLYTMSELSSFVTSRYYSGAARETWLRLWDGETIRYRCKDECLEIQEPRVSLIGGTQPSVFKQIFSGNKGIIHQDGIVFRFLFTHEPPGYFEYTREGWDQENEGVWERLIFRTTEYVGRWLKVEEVGMPATRVMLLDEAGEALFRSWVNALDITRFEAAEELQGFLSKAKAYCLRLTGLLHCINRFLEGGTPGKNLTTEDVSRGIKATMFYLGQAFSLVDLINKEKGEKVQMVSERTGYLAQALISLQSRLDEGKLAISLVASEFNRVAPKNFMISAKGMGGWLKLLGLSKTQGKVDSNGQRAVYCLVWDQSTEDLIAKNQQCSDMAA